MALVSVNNIAVRGISCCVPQNVERNMDLTFISPEEIQRFIDGTGVHERRVAGDEVCTSDLGVKAAEELLDELGWNRDSVEMLVFVSQTADYVLPVTSAILQDRLGFSTKCMAFDIPLGCSGYVYGMSVLTGLMKSFGLKRGILVAGDTSSKWISKKDKSTYPLFGDAASATAFEFDLTAGNICFDLGTDGAGYQAIIIPDGGSRNPSSAKSLEYNEIESGINRNSCQLVLDGMDVFSFGISQAPKTVNSLLNHFNFIKENIDFFVFHQANMMMNKMIAKKLKLPAEKVPYSLKDFGNTSSATIPLTVVTQLKDEVVNKDLSLILCGFGVGLSWGTAHLTLQKETKLIFTEYAS